MFTVAAVAMMSLLGVASVAAMRGGAESRTAAVQLAGVITVLLLIVLSRALGEDSFIHVALVVALMSLVGGLLFARFLEHWL